ncbi:MAG: MFS transporter [Faecalibacterium sp.]|nr:MFS transporter [Faecalibacterium sp.]
MAKTETPQKHSARKAREAAELARRQKEQNRSTPKGYLWYLLVILSIVYIVDEITSAMGSSMQSEVVTDFFVNRLGLDYNTGLASFTAMSAPLYGIMILMPFYKSLADKYGRKLFLVLNTIGMGVGLAICMVAPGPLAYLVGMALINLVMYNDMQVIYVMECAPEKHRAKLTSLTKAVALLGVTLIPILRDVFMGNDGSQWRKVFFVPACLAVVVGTAAIFLMRETPVFVAKRIAFLQLTDDERAAKAASEKQAADQSKGGVGRALKFIFAHRQIRSVTLCGVVFLFSTGVTSYYESIMKTGGMTTAQVTAAMYFIPFFNALMTAIGGFITDGLGRKKSAVLLSTVAFGGLVCFVLCANNGLPPAAVGISYGLFIGGLWSVADLLCLIIAGESTPTYLRASVLGTMSFISGIGSALSAVVITVGMLFVPSIGMLCLYVCAPFMLLAIILLITQVKETKDVDLNTVTGAEWD